MCADSLNVLKGTAGGGRAFLLNFTLLLAIDDQTRPYAPNPAPLTQHNVEICS